MQTLGVSSPEVQEDGFFKRLLWPSVQNQYDVDLIGRRGFWLALAVGVLSSVVTLVQGSPLLALLILLVFAGGAAGIRQRSVAASVLVFTAYTLGVLARGLIASRSSGHISSPLLPIIGMGLLLSCVRATLHSRKFSAAGDEEFPEEPASGFAHALADSYPRIAWPKGKFVFFLCAGLYLFLLLAGSVALAVNPAPTANELRQTSSGL